MCFAFFFTIIQIIQFLESFGSFIKGTQCTIWLLLTNVAVHDDVACLQCAPHAVVSPKCSTLPDLLLDESHEVQELNCNCHQTKSSLSVWKKGVFWGTLEWILLPRRETNWARQASLREWLKLVCGSASAPSNKEKKPQKEREEGGERKRQSEKENDREGKWEQGSLAWPCHINGVTEAGKKRGLFSAVAPRRSRAGGRAGMAEQSRHTARQTHTHRLL